MVRVIIFLLLMSATAFAQDRDGNDNANGTRPGSVGTPLQVQTGSRPVPDPTLLTAQALDALRRELTQLWDQRFTDLQKQIDRNELRLDQIATSTRELINESEKLTTEKFKGLADQQVQRDNNLALALTAQQKSVADQNLSNLTAADKAEGNFKDQISAVQSTITDLKDRITRIESASAGAGGAVNWVIAGIGVFSVLLGIGISLFAMMKAPAPLPVVNYAPEAPLVQRRK